MLPNLRWLANVFRLFWKILTPVKGGGACCLEVEDILKFRKYKVLQNNSIVITLVGRWVDCVTRKSLEISFHSRLYVNLQQAEKLPKR